MARHSSSAILNYLGTSHHGHLVTIAVDASLNRSSQDVRAELKILQATCQQLRAPAPTSAYAGSFDLASLVPAAPAPTDDPQKYVIGTRGQGRVHLVNPSLSTHAFCGWHFNRKQAFKYCGAFGLRESDASPLCARCVRAEACQDSPSSEGTDDA